MRPLGWSPCARFLPERLPIPPTTVEEPGREADFDAVDTYRFSDQRVTRVGRLGFRLPESYTHMTVSSDARWALATKTVRFDADLMQLDNFR